MKLIWTASRTPSKIYNVNNCSYNLIILRKSVGILLCILTIQHNVCLRLSRGRTYPREKVWLPCNHFIQGYTNVVLRLLHQKSPVRLICNQTINLKTGSQTVSRSRCAGSSHTSHSCTPVVNDTGKQCLSENV